MTYNPIQPRSKTEGAFILLAAFVWAAWQLPYLAVSVLLFNYAFSITKHRHAIGYARYKQTATQQKEVKPSKLTETEARMQTLLDDRGFPAKVVNSIDSHRRIVFEVKLPRSFKIAELVKDITDFERATGIKKITIETTVSGKPGISRILIPKAGEQDPLSLTELMESEDFKNSHPLALPMGQNIEGKAEYRRLDKIKHVLVSAASGGGKSVTINCWITALISKNSPQDLQLILIDPKMLEFSIYENSKHLAMPVVLDMQKAQQAIQLVNNEMEYRYEVMSAAKVRSMSEFNDKVKKNKKIKNPRYSANSQRNEVTEILSTITEYCEPFPTLAMIIDEMADLILRFKEVEELIARLAGKARASGISLIPCTQDPRKEVITGLIKANITVRYALQVATLTESQTILGPGRTEAQHLLGNGDAYLLDGNNSVNVQSYYIEADEIEAIIEKQNQKTK